MGTNFHLYEPTCEHCGRSDPPLHIGKSHIDFEARLTWTEEDEPILTLTSWAEWKAYLTERCAAGSVIRDEYGEVHDLERFIADVESSTLEDRRRQFDWMLRDPFYRGEVTSGPDPNGTWLDPDGFTFTARSFS